MSKKPILFVFVLIFVLLSTPFVFAAEDSTLKITRSFLGAYKKTTLFHEELGRYVEKYNLERFAKKFNVPSMFDVIIAIAMYESGGNEKLVSYAGARDILQVIPTTREQMQVETYREAGVKYVEFLSKKFDNLRDVLRGYHAGPARVEKNTVPRISRRYARKVELYRKLLACKRSRIDELTSKLKIVILESDRTWKELPSLLKSEVRKLRSYNAYLVYFFPVYIPQGYVLVCPIKE